MCWTDFSFSLQMNSIISVSRMMRWFTRTVNGVVYALGSSIVTSISQRAVVHAPEPLGHLRGIGQRAALMSSQPPSRSPVVSTTSVSPSHLPAE